MLCIQSHNWMLKWFGDKTNLIAGCYWTHNNVDILPSPYWLYLTLNLTLRQGLSQWPSETPFILNYSDSVKENWTHMATLFFFLDLFIIIVFIPQYCPLLMFILLDYLHRKTARLCYMTVLILLQMKEGNNWRMFLFSDIQICTAGRISRFMAENVKWSIPLPGQFGEHIYI